MSEAPGELLASRFTPWKKGGDPFIVEPFLFGRLSKPLSPFFIKMSSDPTNVRTRGSPLEGLIRRHGE
jgi:hypothetical protein